jgi:hypothetical protein
MIFFLINSKTDFKPIGHGQGAIGYRQKKKNILSFTSRPLPLTPRPFEGI